MINKEGYIFIAKFEHLQLLFGKPIINKKNIFYKPQIGYASIETNEFDLFEKKADSYNAIIGFLEERKEFKECKSARLELKIAQTKAEADSFSDGDLVVICDLSEKQESGKFYSYKRIFGYPIKPCVEFNGIVSRIIANDFRTFEKLGESPYEPYTAKYAAKEVHRQGDNVPVTIAKFKLTRL